MAGTASSFPIAVDPRHGAFFQANPEEQKKIVQAAVSFREFLNYWNFVDQDTGKVRVLGEVLWPAQEKFVKQTEEAWWVFFLKARQLGESTIECAYDGWVARFRDLSRYGMPSATNCRVHLYSKKESDAQKLLNQVKFGLERLPEQWRLPVHRETTTLYIMDAGFGVTDDKRTLQAYPADNDTSRGDTSSHAHVDEWAFMGSPGRVWQAIEPSAAGTVHFVTTEIGPATYTANFFRACLASKKLDRREDAIVPCFIGALERPDRSEKWLAAKRLEGGDDEISLREYPLSWEEALSSGGDHFFKSKDIDLAITDFRGLQDPVDGAHYSIGCDIGRHADSSVFTVLMVGEDDILDVVGFVYLTGLSYPILQQEITSLYRTYNRGRARAVLGVEKNAAGEAVLENLDLPEFVIQEAKFSTTQVSKARILSQLKLYLQNGTLRWDDGACSTLTSEMRGYQLPDENVRQDTVLSLAIAVEYAGKVHTEGRIMGIAHV
jgi:hypothetical protein